MIAEAMAPARGDAAPTEDGACDRESKARHAVMSERLPKDTQSDTQSDTVLDIAIAGRRDKKTTLNSSIKEDTTPEY
jgi:hypothetical protein